MVTCHWWQDEWWWWWWLWWRGRWRRVNDDWACQGQQAVNPPGPVNSSRWWWWLLFYDYHYHCHHHHNQHQDHQQHHHQCKKHHHDKDEYEDHTNDHDVADDAGKDVDDDSDGQGHDGSAHLGAPPPPAARNSPLPKLSLSRSMHILQRTRCNVRCGTFDFMFHYRPNTVKWFWAQGPAVYAFKIAIFGANFENQCSVTGSCDLDLGRGGWNA